MGKGMKGVLQSLFQKLGKSSSKGKGKDTGIFGLDASVKIWVGSLPEGVSDEDIKSAFEAVGTVVGTTPVKNNTCCVAFSSAEEATNAIATFNGGDFNGSTLEVDVWTQKTPVKGYGKDNAAFGQKGFGFGAAKGFGKAKGKKTFDNTMNAFDPSQKVWVGNLPEGITTEELEGAFAVAGTVVAAVTLPKNTASIAFETAEEAQCAIESLNGGDFNGNVIEVDVWTQKEKGKGKGKGKFGKF